VLRVGIFLLMGILMPLTVSNAQDVMARLRERMVETQLEKRGIKNPAVLAAMQKVERHLFVPESYTSQAYNDHPLPIGEGQTISQPYIVALMTEVLKLKRSDQSVGDRNGFGVSGGGLR